MNEEDFEGSLVLERLAEIGKLDEFYLAIDSDDLKSAQSLLQIANIDAQTIQMVLKKMQDADGKH